MRRKSVAQTSGPRAYGEVGANGKSVCCTVVRSACVRRGLDKDPVYLRADGPVRVRTERS
jgi:hypothetical protein